MKRFRQMCREDNGALRADPVGTDRAVLCRVRFALRPDTARAGRGGRDRGVVVDRLRL